MGLGRGDVACRCHPGNVSGGECSYLPSRSWGGFVFLNLVESVECGVFCLFSFDFKIRVICPPDSNPAFKTKVNLWSVVHFN